MFLFSEEGKSWRRKIHIKLLEITAVYRKHYFKINFSDLFMFGNSRTMITIVSLKCSQVAIILYSGLGEVLRPSS